MNGAHLFRLGMDLETGATHEGEHTTEGRANDHRHTATLSVVSNDAQPRDVFDEDREDHFIRRDGKTYAGTHLIIEVVRGTGLDDEARIQKAFRDCVDGCGATLLHIHTHKFSPQGVSGVAVLAESHISVHTWPEIGYGAFDVFMCGDAEPWKAVEILRKAFDAEEMRVKELLRGDGLVA
ncbi:MAG: adenosylmethionine decarboxylase [Rubrimonas sp.]